jgi:hypothetical protein
MAGTMKDAVFWDIMLLALVGADVSEEHIASIFRVTRIGELGTLAVTSNRSKLRRNTDYNEGYTFFLNVDSYKNHTA